MRQRREDWRLRDFLEQLPRDFRFAIEFRHPGWHRPQVIHLLEKHRVCWVWADTSPLNERNLAPFEFLPDTTDFLYLRLLGDYTTKYDRDGERVHRYGKLLWKREAALESWALKIERHLADSRSVWTFVNNHFEGFAPETCQRLANRLGFELPLPSAEETAALGRSCGQLDLFVGQRPPICSNDGAPCSARLINRISALPRNTAAIFPESESSRLAADTFRSAPQTIAATPGPNHSSVWQKRFFPFGILETQIHAPRLKILEVRAARNFEISLLPRRPDLDVVGLR